MAAFFAAFAFAPLRVATVVRSPASTQGVHAFYLCTFCRYDDPNFRVAAVQNSAHPMVDDQIAMFKAEKGKMISVGSGVITDEVAERVRKLGMPIYKTAHGSLTLMRSHTAPGGNAESPRSYMDQKILEQFRQLDRSAPITLYISNHGWNGDLNGDGTLPPEDSGIFLRNQANHYEGADELVLTHRQLSEMLAQAGLVGADAPTVRIVTDYCYSGGIHWISENFPNVCTAAFTSNEKPNYSGDNEAGAFWSYVGAEKSAGRSVSLAAGFYAAHSQQNTTLHLGSSETRTVGAALGSVQYVQNISRTKGILDSKKRLLGDEITDWKSWDLLNDFKSDCDGCEKSYPALSALKISKLSEAEEVLKVLYPSADSGKEYKAAVQALRTDAQRDHQILADYPKRTALTRSEWAKQISEESEIRARKSDDEAGTLFQWILGNFEKTKRADLAEVQGRKKATESQFAEYRSQNFPRIRAYLKNRDLIERILEMKPFAKLYREQQITDEEMNTYRRLSACEAQPL